MNPRRGQSGRPQRGPSQRRHRAKPPWRTWWLLELPTCAPERRCKLQRCSVWNPWDPPAILPLSLNAPISAFSGGLSPRRPSPAVLKLAVEFSKAPRNIARVARSKRLPALSVPTRDQIIFDSYVQLLCASSLIFVHWLQTRLP